MKRIKLLATIVLITTCSSFSLAQIIQLPVKIETGKGIDLIGVVYISDKYFYPDSSIYHYCDSILIQGASKLNPKHIENIGAEYAIEMAKQGADVDFRVNSIRLLDYLKSFTITSTIHSVANVFQIDTIRVVYDTKSINAEYFYNQRFAGVQQKNEWVVVTNIIYPKYLKNTDSLRENPSVNLPQPIKKRNKKRK